MLDFIYFLTNHLVRIDSSLLDSKYPHNRWFNLSKAKKWARHTVSRVTKLDTPWPTAPTICPIPEITENELRFDIVIDSIAEEFYQAAASSNKTVYFCWSGGIDSTSMLVALLRVAPKEFLNDIVIVMDRGKTLGENSYFYYKFLHNRFKIQELSTFEITSDNYDKIIVVDGEAGNQCIQGPSVQRLVYRNQLHLLNEPWRNQVDLKNLLIGATDFHIEILTESIKKAPISIDTGYDFLWWTGFNFKFDDVLLRKMFVYSTNLTPEQTGYFWKHSLYRFYQHPRMQMWSMNARDLRRHYTATTVKYFPKRYIYDFDHNDFYWASKTEQGSDSRKYVKHLSIHLSPYFAFDSEWNKYSIADRSARQLLGKILEKN